MQIEISECYDYIIKGCFNNQNQLKRYIVSGKQLFSAFDRITYIGKIECFECYVCNPETGETGWDIVYIRGVKEKIEKYYPNFDCFITKGTPPSSVEVVEFFKLEHDDYELAEFK